MTSAKLIRTKESFYEYLSNFKRFAFHKLFTQSHWIYSSKASSKSLKGGIPLTQVKRQKKKV